jgi:hypothetical protein
MLSIKECRKVLGNKYKNYTDKQIKAIRDWLYRITDLEKGRLTNNEKK